MKLHKKHQEEHEKVPETVPEVNEKVNENVNIVTKEDNKDIPQHAPIGKKRMPELIIDPQEAEYLDN